MNNTTEDINFNATTIELILDVGTLHDVINTKEMLGDSDTNNTSDERLLLQQTNEAEFKRLIPTVFFLLFLSVCGIAGNSITLYIYKSKIAYSNMRSFVICRSAIDMFTCIVAIPFDISTMFYQYAFDHIWLCKLSTCFDTLYWTSASFLLVSIAVERFRKVCRPLGWQIKTGVSNFLCVLSIALGLVNSIPAAIIYGKSTFFVPEINLTGTECSVADGMKVSSLPFLYTLVFGSLVMAGVIMLTSLYCMIGRKLTTQARRMRQYHERNIEVKASPHELRARKISLLMAVVTLAFVLSFLPVFSLLIISTIKNGFLEGLSDGNRAVYKFFLRSYFWNCAINPIIYWIWDSQFKAACKEMCVRLHSQV